MTKARPFMLEAAYAVSVAHALSLTPGQLTLCD
ncbi:MAG: hypothetical protein ACFWT8_05075 [Lacticaseibacillus casei]